MRSRDITSLGASDRKATRFDRQDEVLMGTFFPGVILGDISCSSFSEIQPFVEANDKGSGFDDRTENLHPRAYRRDGDKRSLF